jgi:hypothetical protein
MDQSRIDHSGDTLRNLFENIDLGNNNKRQDYKIDTVKGVLVGGKRVNEGDEGEGIWLVNFIYLYEIEQ